MQSIFRETKQAKNEHIFCQEMSVHVYVYVRREPSAKHLCSNNASPWTLPG